MDQYALQYYTSFQYAVASEYLNASFAACISDHAVGQDLKPDDLIPFGSVMKGYTSMGIMRLVESGAITLNSTVAPIIDPFLKKINGSSIQDIWGGDDKIN
jgi:CubicO group peptidase (beta-lactamase class C family)